MSTTKNSKFKSAIAVLLMLAIVITGAFAYLTAQDGKKNVFTIGNIDLELVEEDWADVDGDGDFEHNDGLNENILPGHKIPKAPYVKNTGSNAAYTYVTVGVPTMQKDPSRPDPLAVSFSNTSIPVVAYGVQEGYGKVTDSENIWNAYYAENVAEKFGNEVTDEAELLNRVELFELSELGSGWSQLGDVYKSADGFNYYVFAYEGTEPTLAANTETTKVFEYVVLNKAITENQDVLFSPDTSAVSYYVKSDIGEDKAEEIYGVQTNYEYAGVIELDYVPEQDDAYYVSNANVLFTYNATSSQWEAELLSNSVDQDLIPDSILSKNTMVVDPQVDPEPDHQKPQCGDIYEDDAYIYMYGYGYDDIYSDSWGHMCDFPQYSHVLGWGVKVKDYTQEYYPPIKNEIYGEPVVGLFCTFNDCNNLIETPVLPENTVYLVNTFSHCDNLTTVNYLPDSVIDMTSTFAGCTNLTEIHNIPKSIKLMDNVFRMCKKITTMPVLPETLESMDSPFAIMESLSGEIIIPASVTVIDEGLFTSIDTYKPLIIKYYSNNASSLEKAIKYYTETYYDEKITFLNIGEYK